MDSPTLWRSRPIFITSTFRDMHAERDWLRVHVFPVLEERLRERFHHLETVDLRWGVDSTSAEQEQAREHLVLTVCFNEIQRSRPFLIGILGDRYGWTPPAAQLGAAAQEAGLAGDIAGKSVTELEIIHGVLGSVDQRRRSWFYLRAPLPYDAMPRDVAARYSDAYSGEPEAADNVRKLAALKTRLTKELPARVRSYAIRWNPTTNSVEGLEEWGAQVLADVWTDLEAETAAFLRDVPTTWQAQDRWALDEFIEGRVRDFVGRQEITDQLLRFATGEAADDAPWGLCVTSEAGGGKSSLFGRLSRTLRDTGTLVLAHAAGISVRSTQVDLMLRRWVGELAEALGQGDPLDDRSPPDDIDAAFSRLLHQAAATRRVVVLIDALNQFEPTARATHVTWVPRVWPPSARLIATAIPGAQSGALLQRVGMEEKPLPPISEGEAGGIVRRICDRYHRQLNADVVNALLAKTRAGGWSAYGNPLWLELATEQLNTLDSAAFERVDARAGAAGIVALLRGEVEAMPAEIAGLYERLLRDAERHVGEAWTRSFVQAIAVSRAGWRESDFRVLLPRLSGEPWDELRFAAVRRALRAHVVQRGANAQWDFAHAQLRAAVERRMTTTGVNTAGLHDVIGDYLLSVGPEPAGDCGGGLRFLLKRDDPLHEAETMYHLMRGESATRAAEYYGGDRTTGEVAGATRILARMVLGGDVVAVVVLLDVADANEARACIASRALFELDVALESTASLKSRIQLLQSARGVLAALVAADPGNAVRQRDLAVSHSKIGDIRTAQGNLPGALEAYEAALAIATRLAAADPGWAPSVHDLAQSLPRVGDAWMAQGNVPRALAAYEAAVTIATRLVAADTEGAESVSAPWRRELSLCHNKLGDVCMAQGNLPGALVAYEAAQAIRERLTAADPGNAASQRDLAVSHERVGNVRMEQGNLPLALTAYGACLTIATRLAAADPVNDAWQHLVSASQLHVGDARREQGNLPEALAAYESALAIKKRLAAADPENATWQRDLAASQERVGNVRTAQGNLTEALAAYESALAIVTRLATDSPENDGLQHDLVVSHERVGNVRMAQGNRPGALAAYETALAIATQRAVADPMNLTRQNLLSWIHNHVGIVRTAQGNLPEALVAYEAAVKIQEQLAAADPGNAGWQRDLAVSYVKLAEVCGRAVTPGAHEWWRKAHDQLARMKQTRTLLTGDEPLLALLREKVSNGSPQRAIAPSSPIVADRQALLEMAERSFDKGNWEAAAAAYQRLLDTSGLPLTDAAPRMVSALLSIRPQTPRVLEQIEGLLRELNSVGEHQLAARLRGDVASRSPPPSSPPKRPWWKFGR